ncbi:hypothetical protein D3C76_1362840 [compost metagenome]
MGCANTTSVMPINANTNQNSLRRVSFSPRNSAPSATSMNGCVLYTAVAMEIDA